MPVSNDVEELRRHGPEMPDDAFAAIVNRHIDLVYSAALRQVRDAHVAQEVAQTVFSLLAQRARSLKSGTILSGWLYRTTRFVSLEHMRSEVRRMAREKEAMERLSHISHSAEESHWQEIEPLLDEAMAGLDEKDRDLVLLRFFENKCLREVGETFGISEDAAQKRVSRALEKLRAFFAQRGRVVSASALGAAISGFAVQAAPGGLGSLIATATVASTAIAAGTPMMFGILNFMASTKVKVAAVAALLAATSVPIVTQQRALNQAREENRQLRSRIESVESIPRAVTATSSSGRDAELVRLRREAAEVHKLRGEIGLLRQENRPSVDQKPAQSPSASTNPTERMQAGRALMAEGKHAEALEHFLWCYDEGLKHSPAFVGVRSSFLLSELKQLGRVYPPAHEALVARRDATETQVVTGTADKATTYGLIQLNASLDEPARNIALFDQLPEGHIARGLLVEYAADQFLETRRYDEIVRAASPEAAFDRARLVVGATTGGNEVMQPFARRRAVTAGANSLEALAGAAQSERAIALAAKVMEFDPSPETRGELLKHAERAGNEEVISYLRSQAR